MEFDKPKVTIDLEEYMHLKEKSQNVDLDDMYNISRKIAYWCAVAMMSPHATFGDVKTHLKKEGIIIIQNPYSETMHSWEAINI
jgi:hypothetical protein